MLLSTTAFLGADGAVLGSMVISLPSNLGSRSSNRLLVIVRAFAVPGLPPLQMRPCAFCGNSLFLRLYPRSREAKKVGRVRGSSYLVIHRVLVSMLTVGRRFIFSVHVWRPGDGCWRIKNVFDKDPLIVCAGAPPCSWLFTPLILFPSVSFLEFAWAHGIFYIGIVRWFASEWTCGVTASFAGCRAE